MMKPYDRARRILFKLSGFSDDKSGGANLSGTRCDSETYIGQYRGAGEQGDGIILVISSAIYIGNEKRIAYSDIYSANIVEGAANAETISIFLKDGDNILLKISGKTGKYGDIFEILRYLIGWVTQASSTPPCPSMSPYDVKNRCDGSHAKKYRAAPQATS